MNRKETVNESVERIRNKKLEIIFNKKETKEFFEMYENGEKLVNQHELAEIMGIKTRASIIHLKKFKSYVDKGFYPNTSFISPNQKVYLAFLKPLMHFYMFKHWYGTKQEKFIPKYTWNFFDGVM